MRPLSREVAASLLGRQEGRRELVSWLLFLSRPSLKMILMPKQQISGWQSLIFPTVSRHREGPPQTPAISLLVLSSPLACAVRTSPS